MADASLKQYIFKKGSRQGVPVSGTFELTPRCNLDCRMCYIHAPQQDRDALARELSAQQWLDLGRQAVDAGMIYLLLTGGEPTLRPDFAQIYAGMAQMGVVLTVNTNATILTPQLLQLFQRFPPEKVNITLYGMSENTYGALCGHAERFAQVRDNIRTLKSAGVNVNLNTTFTRLNVGDMEAIVDFAKAESIPLRMSSYLFAPVRGGQGDEEVFLPPEELGKAAARFDRLTMEPEKFCARAQTIRKALETPKKALASDSRAASCTAGRGSFWITWDGQMYPCGMLTTGADALGQDFSSAWRQTRENIKAYLLPQECLSCRYQAVCPSCAAVSAGENGEHGVLRKEMCRRTEAYVEQLLAYAREDEQA